MSDCKRIVKNGLVPVVAIRPPCDNCSRLPDAWFPDTRRIKTEFTGTSYEVSIITEDGCYIRE